MLAVYLRSGHRSTIREASSQTFWCVYICCVPFVARKSNSLLKSTRYANMVCPHSGILG